MALPIRRSGALEEGRRPLFGALDPFGEFENMWNEMGRLLERAAAPAATAGAWMPMAEEKEEENAYVVRAELPGVPAENIDIEVEGNELFISGELSEERRGKVLSRRTGHFSYRSTLPSAVDSDKIDADLTDGILTVRIPKSEESKRRKIEIGKHRKTEGDETA
ncbi:Hsp20/alpha crystallin family protein [Streptomyces sp. TRM49041]|uniref:Hsp20/alpha crystallin family protein n=1 Tax=Streptomyces sp. TRM49041 TaxID=2603216 RepID=UPI0011EDCC4A|nr:Hsp20/alpha crystallin family protein [Streptomyces sp. TRM49041]